MPHPEWYHFALAMAGGMLGTAIGAFPAFVLCGLSCIAGTIAFLITGDPSLNETVTWGPVIGPHTAFAGGVAAAACAARQGKLDSGQNILKPLLSLKSIPVFLTGALFGLSGFFFGWVFSLVPPVHETALLNPVALSISVNGFLTRLVIGKSGLFGHMKENQSVFIPAPAENTLPWHMPAHKLMLVSFCTGLPAAFLAVTFPGISGIIFGLAAVSLILLAFRIKIPVLLHIIISAQLAASSTGNIGWGVTFGIIAALVADISACLFLDRGDTHIDPAALAIAVVHPFFALLLVFGIFNLNDYASVPAMLLVLSGGYLLLSGLKRLRVGII